MRATTIALTLLVLALLAAPLLAQDGESQLLKEMQEEMRALRERVKELEAKAENDPLASLNEESLEAMIDQACNSNVQAPGVLDLTIGGSVRVRLEDQINYDFDKDHSGTKEFAVLRTRLTFDLNVTETFRAFVMLQDSRFFGEEGAVIADTGGVDLQEGYFDIRKLFGGLTIRAGRFMMDYGDQRMISSLDWHNVGRSWDGFKFMWEQEDYFIHFFYTRVDENLFTTGVDENEDFAGLYGSYMGIEDQVIDLYLLYRRNNDSDDIVGEDGERGHEKLWSLGARFKGKAGGFDYVAEAGYQFGEYASDDIGAWMFEVGVGYGFNETSWKPHLDLTWIAASGDDDPNDGDKGTWDQLYTFGHYYLGYVDAIGRQNVSSPRLRLKLKPDENWLVFADVHYFWVMTTRDSLYNAGGKAYRSRTGLKAPGKSVGWEIDVHAKVKIEKHFNIWFGWSHFFAGDYLSDTGSSDDADFLFLQMVLNF